MSSAVHLVHEVLISPDEPLFAGHYPGFPVVPGMFVLDLVHNVVTAGRAGAGLPCTVDRAQFHRPVRPGETVTIEAEVLGKGADLVASAVVRVGGELAAELKLRYPGAAS